MIGEVFFYIGYTLYMLFMLICIGIGIAGIIEEYGLFEMFKKNRIKFPDWYDKDGNLRPYEGSDY